MAKKKQFAGKKTKLARLPLTKALASRAEGGAPLSPPPRPSLSLHPHIPLTWDEVRDGRGGPLAAAFLVLVQELAELKSGLQSNVAVFEGIQQTYLPDRVPRPPRLMQALRQARQSLRDLRLLLY